MKNVTITALLLTLSTVAFAADPCQSAFDSGSNAEARECLGVEFQKADKKLNETYKATMARLSPAGREALKVQERQWIKTRDKQCNDGDGGSDAAVMEASCRVDATKKRIPEIDAFRHD